MEAGVSLAGFDNEKYLEEQTRAILERVNMIDSFHLEAYGRTAVNYNRDVEAFPLLSRILTRIQGGEPPYRSPTDMGVNRAGFGVVDDDAVRAAAVQEVIRRYFLTSDPSFSSKSLFVG